MRLPFVSLVSGLACIGFWAGCDVPAPPPAAPAQEDRREAQPARPSGERERQMAFLNRIREADPQGGTIERALLNEQNELGLILNRSVPLDKIPALMRSIMTQMAQEFPGQDLTVIAYTPSNPPHKIGTAHLNARTKDMTYSPVP
ncbi:MAG: hypothetical protein H0V54_09090 [Chthoniobacterales bacterium]|nr:hypothetical protein [Chthoniobacterales bacterium]